jgi:transposase
MASSYPFELRSRVVASIQDEKLSFRDTAERLAVSLRWVVTVMRRWKDEQTLAPRPHGGGRARKIHPQAEGWLTSWLAATPDLTQERLRERLAERGVEVDRSVVSRTLERMGWSYKKSRWSPPSVRAPRSSGRVLHGSSGRSRPSTRST